jgi:hypothetical protein
MGFNEQRSTRGGSAFLVNAARGLSLALCLLTLAPVGAADGRKPGSLLVFPIHRSGPSLFTIVSVTNTNLQPPIGVTLGGATNLHFNYVNAQPVPGAPFSPDCTVFDRVEFVTPADTISRLVRCHNAGAPAQEGYLVVAAQDPLLQPTAWSHNYLIGSETVITPQGGAYSLNAISFRSPQVARSATDRDGDGQYDFDGQEYEGVADDLIVDSFLAIDDASLVLINLTGGTVFDATLKLEIWNDNEFALSATRRFRCWFEQPLKLVSPILAGDWLAQNTPDDPTELDTNCDGVADFETGWVRIKGLEASSLGQSIPNPAVLGALTSGNGALVDSGRLLWESEARQFNGDFLKMGTVDPEHPQ